jgi:hypothetical protein
MLVTERVATADFGTTPSACSSSGVGFDLRATALIAQPAPDFYGLIMADAVLSGSRALSESLWISGSLTLLRYAYSVNATISTTQAELGSSHLGIHGVLLRSERAQLSPYLRILLPTDTGTHYSYRVGAEVGLSALFAVGQRTTIMAGLSFPATATVIGSQARAAFVSRLSIDAAVSPWSSFEFVVGAEAQIGFTNDHSSNDIPATQGRDSTLYSLAPKLALRLNSGSTMLQLAVMTPIAGDDRLTGSARIHARLSLGLSTQF